MRKVLVTIVSIPGCPNVALAEERVRAAGSRAGLGQVAVSHVVVTNLEAAEREHFRGSPTIRIGGVDPFADPTAPVGVACRLYATERGLEGAPSVAQLEAAIRTITSGG